MVKYVENVLKHFTMIIYNHFTVIPSFYVMKQHCHGNYHRIAINCQQKSFTTLAHDANLNTTVIYGDILTLEKMGLSYCGKLQW
jgi:hypothetical protein